MFLKLTIASLEAFIVLLMAVGNATAVPVEYNKYKEQNDALEIVQSIITVPAFDAIYWLWESQYTGESTPEQVQKELANIKAKLKA